MIPQVLGPAQIFNEGVRAEKRHYVELCFVCDEPGCVNVPNKLGMHPMSALLPTAPLSEEASHMRHGYEDNEQ